MIERAFLPERMPIRGAQRATAPSARAGQDDRAKAILQFSRDSGICDPMGATMGISVIISGKKQGPGADGRALAYSWTGLYSLLLSPEREARPRRTAAARRHGAALEEAACRAPVSTGPPPRSAQDA